MDPYGTKFNLEKIQISQMTMNELDRDRDLNWTFSVSERSESHLPVRGQT